MKVFRLSDIITPLTIDDKTRQETRIMFIAKHALWGGSLHPEDGNHAVYHHEVRTILEGLGLNLTLANSFDALWEKPDVDFVFPLLNRAGFFNSEMLGPLLCTRHGIPFLGASPILRGLSDDKHLAKRAAVVAGVPTAPWAIYRRGAPVTPDKHPKAERYVIKPNASSASWGVRDATDWNGIREGVEHIHAEGHDAIVEPFIVGSDVEVPVITKGDPVIMPKMIFRQADPAHLRTYYEKRDLVDRSAKYSLDAYEDAAISEKISGYTRKLWEEYRPFDYGRFEFRVNEETGEVNFLEVNLNCNLWSEKVFGRAALLAGMTQEQLIETILADSLRRNGLMA
ncbi:D-alanine-D-alanine ligase [Altererythrobacter atlanticus]|uniref:D-alanine--D-alanine ligase n=1 Tax=Croceibacterium atlanticum TaxID=1267766 RepID=A0A0F7KSG5_9SPHN|nr:phosphoribosylglycinamide synthetase [Croceibacterium atlanticum]AKH41705.1 D-alanine--D-alanine ligase [Croceibacterium atlanticum]MBB5733169.1 D-alanine-D-alanine ligase [Croceibacterium atlanticum]